MIRGPDCLRLLPVSSSPFTLSLRLETSGLLTGFALAAFPLQILGMELRIGLDLLVRSVKFVRTHPLYPPPGTLRLRPESHHPRSACTGSAADSVFNFSRPSWELASREAW